MCIFKRYIINSLGQRVLVKCGRCPACKQEKAIRRANRIRNEFPALSDSVMDSSQVSLFFTLTYRNDCVPYFDLSAARDAKVYDVDGVPTIDLPVYRDVVCEYRRVDSDYHTKLYVDDRLSLLDTFQVSPEGLDFNFKSLVNCKNNNKIGVCYFPDIQNFIKRLRVNLKRNYSYDKPFKFFVCSELGPTTCRPHFHGLLFISFEDYEIFKCAIGEAWPFDDGVKSKEYCQIARNAASYVSSYVNCDSSIPTFFANNRKIAPRSSFSHGFGFNLSPFTFSKVVQAYRNRDLRYSIQKIVSGTLTDISVPLPKYVVSRYFPKFKGFSRLSNNEVFHLCLSPEYVSSYASRMRLTTEEISQINLLLLNRRIDALRAGLSVVDFAEIYSNIWNVYSSNMLRDSLTKITNIKDYFTAYDNISDYYFKKVRSFSLDDVGDLLPSNHPFLVDFNHFPQNEVNDNALRLAYSNYSKDKKIRNYIFSNHSNV